MTRKELDKYLGKMVKVTLYDDDIFIGEFHSTNDQRFNYMYYKPNYYFVSNINVTYRASHIKKIEVL